MAPAIAVLMDTKDFTISKVLTEDLAFISTLSSSQFSIYMEKKAAAMTKLTQATETTGKSQTAKDNNFRLTKGSPKIAKLGASTPAILEKPSIREKLKEKAKEKKLNLSSSLISTSSPSIVSQETVDSSFEEDSDDIKFTYSDESCHIPKIKSASIDKLIERLTHEVYPGKNRYKLITWIFSF